MSAKHKARLNSTYTVHVHADQVSLKAVLSCHSKMCITGWNKTIKAVCHLAFCFRLMHT